MGGAMGRVHRLENVGGAAMCVSRDGVGIYWNYMRMWKCGWAFMFCIGR